MEMLNQVHVRGIVGNARVQKIGDTEMIRFSVATDHAYTNRSGEKVVEVTCSTASPSRASRCLTSRQSPRGQESK